MFRPPVRRVAALLFAVPALLTTTPADAGVDFACPRGSEIVRFTTGQTVYRYSRGGQVNVCVTDPGLGGVVVSFTTTARPITLPEVTRMPGDCATVVTSVPRVSYGVDAEGVCIGLNGLATVVTFGTIGYDPGVQVWRGGDGALIDQAFCLDKYVGWHLYEPAYDDWLACMYNPHRIV